MNKGRKQFIRSQVKIQEVAMTRHFMVEQNCEEKNEDKWNEKGEIRKFDFLAAVEAYTATFWPIPRGLK